MASEQDKLAQVCNITGLEVDRARFFLDTAGGDVEGAVAYYFESTAGNDDAGGELPGSAAGGSGAAASAPAPAAASAPARTGAYTLSGEPAEALPSGWGGARGGSSSSSRSATPSNPLRSNTGPRVTGFRDLAAASSSGPSFGGRGRDDSDDEDDSKDPTNFYTGGAKSGLSVENPDDKRGGMGDLLKNIMQQAREGSQRLAGAAAERATPSFFGGNAHTLGSDETPSTYIPDPTKQDEDEEEEEEQETVTRHLTFWQDGFSIEDGDLMSYDEHRDILAAIHAGRAPLSLLKVKHDQPVELIISERRNEKWVRQAPPPSGPWGGSGNRLGSASPFPEPAPSTSMPGSLPPSATRSAPPASAAGAAVAPDFEVNRNEPTTQVQIRLRNGERMVATFNHSHTVGDIRRYINASRAGESSAPYVLQTTFPTKDLTDDAQTLKDAGLLGSVVVQRPA
ncbi:hypothetical protein JCM10207_000502 [Rhodosporidiobolus poonsookiae]